MTRGLTIRLLVFILAIALDGAVAQHASAGLWPLDAPWGARGVDLASAGAISSFSSFDRADVSATDFEDAASDLDAKPSAVPEPSGCALFGGGLLFMLYLIRRRYTAMSL